MERTLCLHGNGVPVVQEVTVVVSTSSADDIVFDIRLYEVEDFALAVNDVGEVRDLTAATPVYRYVDLKGVDTNYLLNVRVESEDEEVCAIVSVQPPDCPVSDTENLIRNLIRPEITYLCTLTMIGGDIELGI